MKNLDPIVAEFVKKLEEQGGPPLYTLTPDQARKVLEKTQSEPIADLPVTSQDYEIDTLVGKVSITIFRPKGVKEDLPGIIYVHGAGWVMGDKNTHANLVHRIVDGGQVALVFVNYNRAPEAKYPTAIEQSYEVAKYISQNGKKFGINQNKLIVAGDSVGGNMAIALTQLAKKRKEFEFIAQMVFYPVTDTSMSSASYKTFSDGPWLTKKAMEWFWDAYTTSSSADLKNILVSPIEATLKDLKDLPPALIITDENDVLRDEGEAYAHKLMEAGVDVVAFRALGTIHDFMMLNALADSPATLLAFDNVVLFLSKLLCDC